MEVNLRLPAMMVRITMDMKSVSIIIGAICFITSLLSLLFAYGIGNAWQSLYVFGKSIDLQIVFGLIGAVLGLITSVITFRHRKERPK